MAMTVESRAEPQGQRVLIRVLSYGLLLVGAFVMIVPFLWMASTAFKAPGDAFTYPPTWIPSPFSLESFQEVFTQIAFSRYILNSLIVAVGVTAGEVLTSALAAYAFARLRFPGREPLFLLYLATLMIPGQVTLIPNFILMRYFDWINTFQGLIIPTAFTALGTFLLRQYFLTIPRELEEAARIDGASYFKIWWQIIMPLATPALATLAVFSFMGTWNSFLWPSVMSSGDNVRTLTVALRALVTEYGTEWGMLMAGSLVATIPMVLVFLAAQKYFVRGIATTGMTGR